MRIHCFTTIVITNAVTEQGNGTLACKAIQGNSSSFPHRLLCKMSAAALAGCSWCAAGD